MCCNRGVTTGLSFYTDEPLIFLELRMQTIVEGFGNGKNSEEACAKAAQNALEILQIMTKQ
jgi:dsRNA-specific ribonuclease